MSQWSRLHGWYAWIFVTIFLYPIPGTIALRNVMLALGMVGVFGLAWKSRQDWRKALAGVQHLHIAAGFLALLSLWMVVHMQWLAWYPALSWRLWSGGWLTAWLTGLMVFLLCRFLAKNDQDMPAKLITTVVLALMTHVLWLLLYQAYSFPSVGMDVLGRTPFAQRDYHSTICLTAFSLMLGELMARRCGSQFLRLTQPQLWGLLAMSLLATQLLVTRNGTLVTLVLIMFAMIAYAWRVGRSAAGAVISVLALTLIFGWTSIKSDPRWDGFIDTVLVSTQIHDNLHWLDPKLGKGLPKLANDQPVEESAYDRIAWATAALEQIEAHPLGVGFGHMAFGWAINRAYGVKTGHESSHSGILDFTLANGVPGLVLWLCLTAALMHAGWRLWHTAYRAAGLLLCMHVLAYTGRIILDGHFSGFRFRLYVFILCMLLAAIYSFPRDRQCTFTR